MAQGFKPTTFRTWVSFQNHFTRAPAQANVIYDNRFKTINYVHDFNTPTNLVPMQER